MSTRCRIGILNPCGSVESVYVHWNGYPSGVGLTLLESYNTESRIRELLSFGDMSVLEERIHPFILSEHTFDNPQGGVCIFYGRDRGEPTEQIMQEIKSLKDYTHSETWCDYHYLFKNGEWYVIRPFKSEDKWILLKDVLNLNY